MEYVQHHETDNAGGAVSLLAELVQTHKTYSAFICRLPRQQIPYTSTRGFIYLEINMRVYGSGGLAEWSMAADLKSAGSKGP